MDQKNQFYKTMLAIAIPVAIQNLITSSLNMLDTLMISSLGDITLAGVGLANQVFFFYILICFGINTGSSVLVSQYWGRKDTANVQRVTGFAIALCTGFGLLFTMIALLFPNFIMGLLTRDPEVIASGSRYLQVVSLSYIMTSVSFAFGTSLRSTGAPNRPLYASIVGFFTNGIFNYLLIFGIGFFPRLGVVGAALGTVIARFVEFMMILWYTFRYKGPINASFKQYFNFDQTFIQQYIEIVSPVILNETFWSLWQVLYNIAYAMTGTESTAAVQIVASIQNILFVLVRGLANSCTIMIGSSVGRGETEEAYDLGLRFIKIVIILGIIIGTSVVLGRDILLMAFPSLSPTVRHISSQLLIVIGLFYVLKAFNSIIVVGILRGGGDTRFSMFMETFAVWLVGVPLAFIGAKFLGLPILWVMSMVLMDEVVKAIVGFMRFRSQKWIHVIK
ncbi:MATE family efflux transporter [Globicatella sulfidifaciens]|uniref:Probable multidrug resistance protein NorM n=1 Tax=Globicatella sulfidifaciens DSM 15739 TaxID=1121925 RepID=A0A1T4N9M4_9LACT|nr:MATE family efflux transporter [Globicatella sulfidifaciens]SJZ75891.1 putative efflux protein, MATE family [Globicatella sulfidifaciens DSM 15739]